MVQAARRGPLAEQVVELVGVHGPASLAPREPPGGLAAYIPTMRPPRLVRAAPVGGAWRGARASPAARRSPRRRPAPRLDHRSAATGLASRAPARPRTAAGGERRARRSRPPRRHASSRSRRSPGGPLAIAAPDDGTGRLFVAAQDGRIWVVDATARSGPTRWSTSATELRSGGEQGLLGLALHPGFPTDPRVFVELHQQGRRQRSSPAWRSIRTTRIASIRRASARSCSSTSRSRTTTAATCCSGRTATCTRSSATAAAAATRTATARTATRSSARSCGSTSTTRAAIAYALPPDNPFAGRRRPRRDLARRPAQPVAGVVRSGDGRPVDRRRRPGARGRRSTSPAPGVGGLNFGWNRDGGQPLLPTGSRRARPPA